MENTASATKGPTLASFSSVHCPLCHVGYRSGFYRQQFDNLGRIDIPQHISFCAIFDVRNLSLGGMGTVPGGGA